MGSGTIGKQKTMTTSQLARAMRLQSQTVRKAALTNNIGEHDGKQIILDDTDIARLVFKLHLDFDAIEDKRTKQYLRSNLFNYYNSKR